MHCIETAKDIIAFFSWLGSHIILVFEPKRCCTIPRGIPQLGGGLNKRQFRKKIAIFD